MPSPDRHSVVFTAVLNQHYPAARFQSRHYPSHHLARMRKFMVSINHHITL
jgi:hypothetical protein